MQRDPLYTEDPIETEANVQLVQWAFSQGLVYPGLQITHELLAEWRDARAKGWRGFVAPDPRTSPPTSDRVH